MSLILVFAVLAVIGQAVNVTIAMQIDPYSETASLAVFFILLVTFFWLAWKLAWWLTEPRAERRPLRHQQAGRGA
jgi:hypothetical protein